MGTTNFDVVEANSFSGPMDMAAGSRALDDRVLAVRTVEIDVVDGAAAGTFAMPDGAVVTNIWRETATAIPGSPTNTNLRIGSGANGQQYVADVDVKAQGFAALTLLYAARNIAETVHYTVASSGGTASSQDGTILLHVEYMVP